MLHPLHWGKLFLMHGNQSVHCSACKGHSCGVSALRCSKYQGCPEIMQEGDFKFNSYNVNSPNSKSGAVRILIRRLWIRVSGAGETASSTGLGLVVEWLKGLEWGR